MFEELTGSRAAEKVVLATTMWDKLPDESIEIKREQRLKEEYWNDMISHGAAVERFVNTSDSAWRIVDNVIIRNKNDQKTVLRFQEERVDQKKRLKETSAAKALDRPYRTAECGDKESMWWLLGYPYSIYVEYKNLELQCTT